jgi:hypothetical protein
MKEHTMSHSSDAELSGRHPVNIGHLVMGLAFVGLVGVWALIQGDVVEGDDIRWLLPLPWVIAGIAGLLATMLTGRSRRAERLAGWVETTDPYATTDDPYAIDDPYAGTTDPYAADWTTDNPYRNADPTDPTEETR